MVLIKDYYSDYVSEDNGKIYAQQMKKCMPISDEVTINCVELKKLEKLLHISQGDTVPSDLLFCQTIPLQSVKIRTEYRGCKYQASVIISDVVYYKGFNGLLETIKDDANVVIGFIIISEIEYILLEISKSTNHIFVGSMGLYKARNYSDKEISELIDRHNELVGEPDCKELLSRYVGMFMEIWYAIQLSLLNPITQTLFKSPAIYAETQKKPDKKNSKKRKVKYIRKHYITADNISEIVENRQSSERKYTCLAWYVCGHWRTYKNGKRIFVQPYWKGELREARAKLEGLSREREIAQLSDRNIGSG